MPPALHLDLPDGRGVDFKVRKSARARSVWLRVTARDGLVVTAPTGVPLAEVMRLVANKADWVARHLDAFEIRGQTPASRALARPEDIALRALDERWSVDYRQSASTTVSARAGPSNQVLVLGAIGDLDACQAALRRWLMRYAKAALEPWFDALCEETGLSYSGLSVKNQRSRWGSCTHQCRISLNGKLLFLPPEQVRYVMVHELCHTLEHNHSTRFWERVRRHEPRIELMHASMREAWRLIPDWAHHR
ncbi:M48 family metallopeptidase [Thiocystis violacea]|uniref:M48 family metallopeptidase n=1 Tax=Thiocystis violacea TaxID=13725 RepID=UPI001904D7A0|nr:SprT family zinc-dependent metalloprotease [Thiocystis violacea]MBK1722709.1 hypothetical protein [Thiocystis violacea]